MGTAIWSIHRLPVWPVRGTTPTIRTVKASAAHTGT